MRELSADVILGKVRNILPPRPQAASVQEQKTPDKKAPPAVKARQWRREDRRDAAGKQVRHYLAAHPEAERRRLEKQDRRRIEALGFEAENMTTIPTEPTANKAK